MPALTVVTAAASYPLTVEDAKAHLRVYHTDDDAYIEALIAAATSHVENFTRRALITQTWDMKLDTFGGWYITIPKPPLQSVTAANFTYVDGAGSTTQVSTSVYDVDTDSEPGRVTLAYSQTWPTPRTVPHAVSLRFVAGYGDDGADVPAPILHAIKLYISHLYENREPVVTGTISTAIPETLHALLYPYQVPLP